MSLRDAFRRIAAFGRDLPTEVEQMERNITAKFVADDASSWGPWTITDVLSAALPPYVAGYWQIVRLDPSLGAFTVFLPNPRSPDAAAAGWVWFKNVTVSATLVTIQPIDSAVLIDGASTAGIAASGAAFGGVLRLMPDPVRNAWMVL